MFDSGVGGLAVLREVRSRLPDSDLIYAADSARAPFGPRQLRQVAAISHEIAEWLVGRGASCLVVACNTASAAALDSLRRAHPDISVVGMEPAVKPAAAGTNSGKVAVYATAATFQGRLYDSVMARFAGSIEVLARACPEWVDLVERGVVSGAEAEASVRGVVEPSVRAGADQIVLGCTHFSFLEPLISAIGGVPVIDPAPAVAAQVARVAPATAGTGSLTLATSGDMGRFAELAGALAGTSGQVIPLWS